MQTFFNILFVYPSQFIENNLTTILPFVTILIWQIILVGIAIFFRDNFRDLIKRMRGSKIFGNEFSFDGSTQAQIPAGSRVEEFVEHQREQSIGSSGSSTSVSSPSNELANEINIRDGIIEMMRIYTNI